MGAEQIIRTAAGEELVVLHRRDYDALRARAGDEVAEDAMTHFILAETRGQIALPETIWRAVEAGDNPVRVARELRAMTQADLAAAVGVEEGVIYGLENGREIRHELLAPIADILGVPAEFLIS